MHSSICDENTSMTLQDLQNGNVKATLSESETEAIFALFLESFKGVERYMYRGFSLDFEAYTSIDYVSVLNNQNLRLLIEYCMKERTYPNEELLYLIYRNFMIWTWRPDPRTFLHMEEIAQATAIWHANLIMLSKKMCERGRIVSSLMPYWLRNEQSCLMLCVPQGCNSATLRATEIVMTKSNDIQIQCRSLGLKRFIYVDIGLYYYLSEWIKIILCNYRLVNGCIAGDVKIKELIKTTTQLMTVIVDVLVGKESVYKMPQTAMIFSRSDAIIIKEIVTLQIGFSLAHEYGHALMGYSNDYHGELKADALALEWVCQSKGSIDTIVGMEYKNDIQSDNVSDRVAESIELLFVFYELFYFIKDRRYFSKKQLQSYHPKIAERRKQCRRWYSGIDCNRKLIQYTDQFVDRIKKQYVTMEA